MRRRALALALLLCAPVACASGEPATNRWQPLQASTLARTEVAAARVGRFVYVMGGFERRHNEKVEPRVVWTSCWCTQRSQRPAGCRTVMARV